MAKQPLKAFFEAVATHQWWPKEYSSQTNITDNWLLGLSQQHKINVLSSLFKLAEEKRSDELVPFINKVGVQNIEHLFLGLPIEVQNEFLKTGDKLNQLKIFYYYRECATNNSEGMDQLRSLVERQESIENLDLRPLALALCNNYMIDKVAGNDKVYQAVINDISLLDKLFNSLTHHFSPEYLETVKEYHYGKSIEFISKSMRQHVLRKNNSFSTVSGCWVSTNSSIRDRDFSTFSERILREINSRHLITIGIDTYNLVNSNPKEMNKLPEDAQREIREALLELHLRQFESKLSEEWALACEALSSSLWPGVCKDYLNTEKPIKARFSMETLFTEENLTNEDAKKVYINYLAPLKRYSFINSLWLEQGSLFAPPTKLAKKLRTFFLNIIKQEEKREGRFSRVPSNFLFRQDSEELADQLLEIMNALDSHSKNTVVGESVLLARQTLAREMFSRIEMGLNSTFYAYSELLPFDEDFLSMFIVTEDSFCKYVFFIAEHGDKYIKASLASYFSIKGFSLQDICKRKDENLIKIVARQRQLEIFQEKISSLLLVQDEMAKSRPENANDKSQYCANWSLLKLKQEENNLQQQLRCQSFAFYNKERERWSLAAAEADLVESQKEAINKNKTLNDQQRNKLLTSLSRPLLMSRPENRSPSPVIFMENSPTSSSRRPSNPTSLSLASTEDEPAFIPASFFNINSQGMIELGSKKPNRFLRWFNHAKDNGKTPKECVVEINNKAKEVATIFSTQSWMQARIYDCTFVEKIKDQQKAFDRLTMLLDDKKVRPGKYQRKLFSWFWGSKIKFYDDVLVPLVNKARNEFKNQNEQGINFLLQGLSSSQVIKFTPESYQKISQFIEQANTDKHKAFLKQEDPLTWMIENDHNLNWKALNYLSAKAVGCYTDKELNEFKKEFIVKISKLIADLSESPEEAKCFIENQEILSVEEKEQFGNRLNKVEINKIFFNNLVRDFDLYALSKENITELLLFLNDDKKKKLMESLFKGNGKYAKASLEFRNVVKAILESGSFSEKDALAVDAYQKYWPLEKACKDVTLNLAQCADWSTILNNILEGIFKRLSACLGGIESGFFPEQIDALLNEAIRDANNYCSSYKGSNIDEYCAKIRNVAEKIESSLLKEKLLASVTSLALPARMQQVVSKIQNKEAMTYEDRNTLKEAAEAKEVLVSKLQAELNVLSTPFFNSFIKKYYSSPSVFFGNKVGEQNNLTKQAIKEIADEMAREYLVVSFFGTTEQKELLKAIVTSIKLMYLSRVANSPENTNMNAFRFSIVEGIFKLTEGYCLKSINSADRKQDPEKHRMSCQSELAAIKMKERFESEITNNVFPFLVAIKKKVDSFLKQAEREESEIKNYTPAGFHSINIMPRQANWLHSFYEPLKKLSKDGNFEEFYRETRLSLSNIPQELKAFAAFVKKDLPLLRDLLNIENVRNITKIVFSQENTLETCFNLLPLDEARAKISNSFEIQNKFLEEFAISDDEMDDKEIYLLMLLERGSLVEAFSELELLLAFHKGDKLFSSAFTEKAESVSNRLYVADRFFVNSVYNLKESLGAKIVKAKQSSFANAITKIKEKILEYHNKEKLTEMVFSSVDDMYSKMINVAKSKEKKKEEKKKELSSCLLWLVDFYGNRFSHVKFDEFILSLSKAIESAHKELVSIDKNSKNYKGLLEDVADILKRSSTVDFKTNANASTPPRSPSARPLASVREGLASLDELNPRRRSADSDRSTGSSHPLHRSSSDHDVQHTPAKLKRSVHPAMKG